MNKICTSIEQSRTLIELGIDIDTADMYWAPDADTIVAEPYITKTEDETLIPAYKGAIPAWSLNSLLNMIKKREDCNKVELFSNYASKWALTTTYYDAVWEGKEIVAEEPIDAAFEMVCWLLKR